MKYAYIIFSFVLFFMFTSCSQQKVDTNEEVPATSQVKVDKKPNPMTQKMSKSEVIEGGMDWLTLEEVQELIKKDKKKVLVDVYTDWCGWCKVMDKKTFADPEVKEYLEKNFHVVKFNAEQKDPIMFKGTEYAWKPSGRRGVNMLAVQMLNGRLGYPTIVYLDEDLNKIKAIAGYKTPAQLMADIKSL